MTLVQSIILVIASQSCISGGSLKKVIRRKSSADRTIPILSVCFLRFYYPARICDEKPLLFSREKRPVQWIYRRAVRWFPVVLFALIDDQDHSPGRTLQLKGLQFIVCV